MLRGVVASRRFRHFVIHDPSRIFTINFPITICSGTHINATNIQIFFHMLHLQHGTWNWFQCFRFQFRLHTHLHIRPAVGKTARGRLTFWISCCEARKLPDSLVPRLFDGSPRRVSPHRVERTNLEKAVTFGILCNSACYCRCVHCFQAYMSKYNTASLVGKQTQVDIISEDARASGRSPEQNIDHEREHWKKASAAKRQTDRRAKDENRVLVTDVLRNFLMLPLAILLSLHWHGLRVSCTFQHQVPAPRSPSSLPLLSLVFVAFSLP